ncbi:MAG: hypothetical protein GY853_14370 [PVC group bacterium]|nr:hypothetical protein [PVC group bacterium]
MSIPIEAASIVVSVLALIAMVIFGMIKILNSSKQIQIQLQEKADQDSEKINEIDKRVVAIETSINIMESNIKAIFLKIDDLVDKVGMLRNGSSE